MTRYLQREIQWDAVFKSGDLPSHVQSHLGKVYGSLALAVLASAAGTRYALIFGFNSLLATILSFVLLIAFLMTPHHPSQPNLLRQSLFVAFSFVEGLAITPLMDSVLRMDGGKEIIAMAAISTLAIFTAMSLLAFFSQRRSYLYLGGMLMTGLNLLLFSSFANFFFRSPFLFDIELYFGLIVFVGYVVFDTQLIIEKASHGDDDHLAHSLELFLDVLNLFVRLVILLAKRKKDD